MSENLHITQFYGASWCADCRRSKRFLEDNNIPFTSIDIDEDPSAAQEVVRINKGYKSIPTIIFSDGSILSEPSNQELATKLSIV